MKSFIQHTFSMLFLLFSSSAILSQDKNIQITGQLIEEATSQAIPYATVVLHDKTTKKIIAGTTSDDSGKFSISTSNSNFYLEVSFMGFETKNIQTFNISNNKADLGKIILAPDNQTLDEVVITGEVSKTVFKLDKRVFNVGADISSTGGCYKPEI